MTSVDLSALPSVAFAPQSAGETETAIITAYEAIAKTTLQPGDPVRLFLESLAYILSVQNGLIDLAGKQNLLAYARGRSSRPSRRADGRDPHQAAASPDDRPVRR